MEGELRAAGNMSPYETSTFVIVNVWTSEGLWKRSSPGPPAAS